MSRQTEFKPPSSTDGSVIAVLAHPIKFDGEDVERVSIPALKGKHLARVPWSSSPTVGQQIEWANWVVKPIGVVNEMHPADANRIAQELIDMLGKSLATGETPSE